MQITLFGIKVDLVARAHDMANEYPGMFEDNLTQLFETIGSDVTQLITVIDSDGQICMYEKMPKCLTGRRLPGLIGTVWMTDDETFEDPGIELTAGFIKVPKSLDCEKAMAYVSVAEYKELIYNVAQDHKIHYNFDKEL